ncbi:hypothetical protein EDB80DRAFT_873426 [Ilyonectria destructans]|nr:hypothetical protein EDB80DRAFT_873426 [Ilyonectria destructans]
MSNMVSYEPYVNECTELLCRRLEEFSATDSPVNMAHWFQCYAFDMIVKITFSKRLGCLDAGEDPRNIIKTLETFAWLSSAIGVYPFLYPTAFKAL